MIFADFPRTTVGQRPALPMGRVYRMGRRPTHPADHGRGLSISSHLFSAIRLLSIPGFEPFQRPVAIRPFKAA